MASKVLPIHHSGIPSERGVCLLAELPPVGNIRGDRIVVEDQNYATYVWYGTEWKNPMFVATPGGGVALAGAGGSLPLSGYHPDFNVDCIVSGMALPTTGGLANSITAGVAYVTGYRAAFSGVNITLSASSDNYVDAKADGTYAVLPVANGAAAPAVTVNALRVGYVVTGASTVSSAVVTGKDSLGNWMGNRSPKAAVVLGGVTNQSAAAGVDTSINFGLPSTITGYGPEILDNQGVHSATTNSHRIPILVTGLYQLAAQCALGASAGATTLAIRKNANLTVGIPTCSVTPAAPQTLAVGGRAYLTVGDFVYVRVNSAAGTALTEVAFSVTPA